MRFSASSARDLPAHELRKRIASLTTAELRHLAHDWKFWARDDQLPPYGCECHGGEWRVWLCRAGRGWGKTRTGAEYVRHLVDTGRARRIHLVARTAADARDVMVEGESGILAVWPERQRPLYEPSKRRLTFHNGAVATVYSADEPALLRGPQCDAAWADELASWARPEAWDNLLLGLRLGDDPRVCVTTTPQPSSVIRALSADPATHLTRGSTMDNAANLAPQFLSQVLSRYRGTRLEAQEIHGELLEDVEGAILTREQIAAARVEAAPDLQRIAVAIDPALTSGDASDLTGIVVCGVGFDGDLYVLADRSCRLGPTGWARRAVEAWDEYEADVIVVEKNAGGEMAEAVLRQVRQTLPIRMRTASRSKVRRAEPVLALYEQGRAHDLADAGLDELEAQLLGFTSTGYMGEGSPDRADALVHGARELIIERRAGWAELGYGSADAPAASGA